MQKHDGMAIPCALFDNNQPSEFHEAVKEYHENHKGPIQTDVNQAIKKIAAKNGMHCISFLKHEFEWSVQISACSLYMAPKWWAVVPLGCSSYGSDL